MATASYFDGRSARRRSVEVRIAGDALDIRDEGGRPLARWSLDDLSAVVDGGSGDGIRLRAAAEPDARLILTDAELIAHLERRAPKLRGRAASWSLSWKRATGIGAVAAVVVGLAALALPSVPRVLAELVPLSWEKRLGEQVAASILEGTTPCTAPAGRAALDRLVERLTRVIELPYPASVSVHALPIENAFAAPGGMVVIGSELIAQMESADELAGVLAHELGHVAERHPTTSAIRILGISFFIDVMVGGSSGVADTLAQGAGLLVGLSYSRAGEHEADRIAVEALREAGIRPDGLARFFARMAEQHGALEQGRLGTALGWLSTHPSFAARLAIAGDTGSGPFTPALPDADWQALRTICDER